VHSKSNIIIAAVKYRHVESCQKKSLVTAKSMTMLSSGLAMSPSNKSQKDRFPKTQEINQKDQTVHRCKHL
jgi:hypothetical protein